MGDVADDVPAAIEHLRGHDCVMHGIRQLSGTPSDVWLTGEMQFGVMPNFHWIAVEDLAADHLYHDLREGQQQENVLGRARVELELWRRDRRRKEVVQRGNLGVNRQ